MFCLKVALNRLPASWPDSAVGPFRGLSPRSEPHLPNLALVQIREIESRTYSNEDELVRLMR